MTIIPTAARGLVTLQNIASVDIRLATEEDKELPAYDHTYFSNLSMCPTWGIVRYGHHKRMSAGGRAMALEAGSACHDMFAAVRLLEVLDRGHTGHFDHHGRRIFGDDRWNTMSDFAFTPDGNPTTDATERLNFVLTALHTSGFYDDPRDKRRTLATLEECGIAYFDRWRWGRRPVWIRDPSDPTSDIGVECAVELVLEFMTHHGDKFAFRYTGRVDGIHHRNTEDDSIVVHENKTGSRIDETWLEGMRMTHQITGYVVWASTFTGRHCERAVALGLAIPLPRSYDFGGVVDEPIERQDHHVRSWLDWCLYCYQIDQLYRDNPLNAPKFTHSCNRYYRPCSLIPLCNSPREEQPDIFDEMPVEEWNPLTERGGTND